MQNVVQDTLGNLPKLGAAALQPQRAGADIWLALLRS